MGRRGCAVVVGALIVGAPLLAACGPRDPSAAVDPTIPHVDFTPKLVLEVGDDTLTPATGPRPDPDLRLDPPVVMSGTVIEVRNSGSEPHRLTAGNDLDTGTMLPGESTVAILTNTGDEDKKLELRDAVTDQARGTLVVRPRKNPEE